MLTRDSNLVSAKEAAQILGINMHYLYRNTDTIPHYRIGRAIKFDLRELEALFRRGGEQSASQ